MSGRFVRASKFRHVFGTKARAEKSYTNMKIECTGDFNHIAASTGYFGVVTGGGGGPIQVTQLGRYGRLNPDAPRVNVHRQKVTDLDFSPFIENLLATASEDSLAKVTAVTKDGNIVPINTADQTLEGHQKKLCTVRWSPTASSILATAAFDNTVKVWDVEKGKDIFTYQGTAQPLSVEWNEDGSLIAAASKDGKIRIYDPRSSAKAMEAGSLEGAKPPRICWLHGLNKLALVGFARSSTRQYSVYDTQKFSAALTTQELDSGAGSIIPYFDADNSVMYLAGKGDAAIKYWEAVNDEPYLHFLSEFRESESTKGCCFLPKVCCDTKITEVAVALRILRDGVFPVSFTVPRKSDQFQSDIFPDTYAGRPVMTAAEWASGTNRAPAKRSMRPGTAVEKSGSAAPVFEKSSGSPAPSPTPTTAPPAAATSSGLSLQQQLDAANARIAELKKEVATLRGH